MDTILLTIVENSNSIIKSFLGGFANGIRNGGNKIFEFNILDYNILDCQGCTEDIFFQPNGSCKCEDDFTSIYPFLMKCQFLVFAVDLDNRDAFKELNKILIRMEPIFPVSINGISEQKSKKLLTIVFSRLNNGLKDKIEELVEEFANLYNYEYLGSLYRPQYKLLEHLPTNITKSFAFEEDFYRFGRELISTGAINNSLKERIERDLLPEDSLFRDFLPFISENF